MSLNEKEEAGRFRNLQGNSGSAPRGECGFTLFGLILSLLAVVLLYFIFLAFFRPLLDLRNSALELMPTADNDLLIASSSGNLEGIRQSLRNGAYVNARDREGRTPLMLATANLQLEAVKLLTLSGADPNIRNHDGITAVTIAARLGPSGNEIKDYLDAIQTLEAPDSFWRLSLFIILGLAVVLVVVLLVINRWGDIALSIRRSGVKNLDAVRGSAMGTTDESQALLTAATSGDSEQVAKLLESGIAPDVPGHLGLTALMLGASHGHFDVVRLLLESGANPEARNERQRTPLIFASFSGNVEVIELLLDAGANPNAVDQKGNTALIYAALLGNRGAAELFLARGADSGHRDKRGRTADDWGFIKSGTHWVKEAEKALSAKRPTSPLCHLQQRTLVRLGNLTFLILGALLSLSWAFDLYSRLTDISPSTNISAPTVTSVKPDEKLSKDLPASNKSEPNTLPYRQVPLPIWPRNAQQPRPMLVLGPEGSELVLPGEHPRERRSNVSLGSLEYIFYYHLIGSSKGCHLRTARKCLEKGINVNVRAGAGRTPLSLACEHNCVAVAKLLLARGANVNSADDEGRTPLMWACGKGNYDMIELLLGNGADRSVKDRNGRTALAYVQEHCKMVQEQRIRGGKARLKTVR